MVTQVVFPDAAALAIDWLTPELAPVGVHSKVPGPDDRPERFVTVRRHGGPRASLVSDRPQLGVECWAQTEGEADALAQLARAHLMDMRGRVLDGTAVYRVTEISGPADLPDPISEQPRSVFAVEVHLRGAPLPPLS